MGTSQSWCIDSQATKQVLEQKQKVFPTRLNPEKQRAVSCQSRSLTTAVETSYNRLKKLFGNNNYLDVPEQTMVTGVQERDSYYKLSSFDAVYKGYWKNQLPNGRGIAQLANGCMIVGNFSDGYCSGEKNYVFFPSGAYYVGTVISNQIAGKGKLVSQQMEYQGGWEDGLPYGPGTQKYANGNTYIGNFEKGLKNGQDGLFIWGGHSQFLQYKGGFKDGKIFGEGVLMLRNKCKIQGFFEDNHISKCVLQNLKYRIVGEFQKGKLTKKAVIDCIQSKQRIQGHFQQGQLKGKSILRDSKERNHQFYAFNNRQLNQMEGLTDQQLQKIIQQIDKAYSHSQKHSDAFIEINQKLEDEYQCKFVEPFYSVIHYPQYVIFQIYQKFLLIKKKQKK